MAAPKPIWVRQAEEAKLKSEADTTAAAKAAFDATFRALSASAHADQPPQDLEPSSSSPAHPASFPALRAASANSDSDSDDDDRPRAPPGPVDPAKSSAAGPGIAGGSAAAPATFTVVGKDRDGRRVTSGGASVRVRVRPADNSDNSDLEGAVRDNADGSYVVTYVVPRRGNYMVHVDLDGAPIMGSPFPVFFSAASTAAASPYPTATTAFPTTSSAYPNMVNQTMPNMPNYAGSLTSGPFPSMIGLFPGSSTGSSGGVTLPGVGASLGEICREHINGKCTKGTDCRFSHPPQQLLMSVMAAQTSVSTLGHAPMAPSAAAMAAAQAIMAAQALQAHAAKMQADAKAAAQAPGPTEAEKAETLKRTVQISNLSPLLTVEHLKQMFGYVGKVVDCTIADSKHTAYVEYTKPEEATAALALGNVDVGGRPLNVEMAKSLPQKATLANSNLPLMMQQAVQLQQMQFQQALMMQTALAAQQTASRAATMKNATEAAAARAAEISRKLKAEGFGGETVEEKEAKEKSRSLSPPSRRSKSRSRSPIKYHRSRRDRSYSPPVRRSREHRSRSPSRSHHYSKYGSDRSYRDDRDKYSRSGRREGDRSRDHYSSSSRRNRSRSISPRYKKSSRADSRSPKRQREESLSPLKSRRSGRADSRSPRRHKGSKSSPTRDERSSRRSRHSRSRSQERKHRSSEKKDVKKSETQDDKKRSSRSSRGGKDERSVKDPVDDKNVDTSVVAHKRSSSVSEDEMLTSDNGNHKKPRHDAALEYDKRKNEDSIEDGAGMTGDKIVVDRKYREDESKHSTRDKSSRHLSSRSHRSSRRSGEKHHRDGTDQHELKRSEEGARAKKDSSSLDDPFSSDKKKVHKESSPDRKLNQSKAGSDSEGINHDTEVRLRNALLEKANLVIQEDLQFADETGVSSTDKCSADVPLPASVSNINGQHGPEGDGALGESAI
ncbi:hypothetical protein QYE76_035607 [Lolium multiflorum]|uniref:RNA recognition motif (RRM)-containing protein n=1 Tax=Lolium multiflorum TaxID=4521 RepID=A0AAD8R1Y7_LOLMU|nr:hypothetical protein QYE76_035607 [Lolium multiflorum]